MAFGLNRAELIGRLGADVTINHLASGDASRTSRLPPTRDTSTSNPAIGWTRPSGTGS